MQSIIANALILLTEQQENTWPPKPHSKNPQMFLLGDLFWTRLNLKQSETFTNYGHPIEWSRLLYFYPVVSFYLLLSIFFSRLISAAAHWMSNILRHMMWP